MIHTKQGFEGKAVIRTPSLDDPAIAKPDRVIYASGALFLGSHRSEIAIIRKMTLQDQATDQYKSVGVDFGR